MKTEIVHVETVDAEYGGTYDVLKGRCVSASSMCDFERPHQREIELRIVVNDNETTWDSIARFIENVTRGRLGEIEIHTKRVLDTSKQIKQCPNEQTRTKTKLLKH